MKRALVQCLIQTKDHISAPFVNPKVPCEHEMHITQIKGYFWNYVKYIFNKHLASQLCETSAKTAAM